MSGHQVNLAVGANTITVMVEAEDAKHGDLHGHGYPRLRAQRRGVFRP